MLIISSLETTKCYLKCKINSQVEIQLNSFNSIPARSDKVTVIICH